MAETGPSRSRGAAALAGAVLALSLAACSSGQNAGASGGKPGDNDGTIEIAYLQKQGDQQYFINEAAGARKKAEQLGAKLKVVNLGNNANKAVSATQAAVAQGYDGIIIVVPDPAVGPQVVNIAKQANVALLASDDQICVTSPDPTECPEGELVPRVGFSGPQMGKKVGKTAGELFTEAGWKPSETRIIAAWKRDVTVCTKRVEAAKRAFEQTTGENVEVIEVGTDNTAPEAQSKTAGVVNAHRSVEHWVVWGCNDENVTGAVRGIQNAGYSAQNIIGVGLGAYLACKQWKAGKPTGVKASLFINGRDVGRLAVQTMYQHLKGGAKLPQEKFAKTQMVTPDNWRQSGLKCSS